tara:strand:+ start:1219 stop:1434 length:216 start_codon:yes stop_codon:yes gene_type:complete
MSDSISFGDGFLTKENIWAVYLGDIQFITWKENFETGNYFVKLHIGAKETRIQLDTLEEIEELMAEWKNTK